MVEFKTVMAQILLDTSDINTGFQQDEWHSCVCKV